MTGEKLVSINETCINDNIQIPDNLVQNYTFINANNPTNTGHGGVGLFYKDSLPLKVRYDLSFPESIVVELRFGRKSVFLEIK